VAAVTAGEGGMAEDGTSEGAWHVGISADHEHTPSGELCLRDRSRIDGDKRGEEWRFGNAIAWSERVAGLN
jgi:hypothetical protein